MASVDLVRISVTRESGTWQTRYGHVVRDYESEATAIVAAISQARDLGSQGRFVAVVMRTLTSVYGPTGLIRTLPTRGRPMLLRDESTVVDEVPALADPEPPVAPAILDELPALDGPVLEDIEERQGDQFSEVAEDSVVISTDEPEPPGRFMRIVAALAREAEEKVPVGRSFHQTISRLARSRRMT